MSAISERSGEPMTKEAHAEGLRAYREAGQKRGQAIGNRGPLRLGDDGKLHPDILDAFHTQGFYIFERVIDAGEIAALRHDANVMLERAPVNRDAKLDAQGRPPSGSIMPACPIATPSRSPTLGAVQRNSEGGTPHK